MTDTAWMGIGELAELIRTRALSPVELAAETLERIEARNDDLHAFISTTGDRALAEARTAADEIARGAWRGPLHGIPYAAKDLFDVAGEATGAGTHLLADDIAEADCTVVARLRDAGMVLVGKTHTVQFAYGGVGINHDTGTPRNPWSTVPHVPGGSSSGSGVAVGGGLVPMALGSDTSGSVRIPASLCGTTGLKTTVGRVSRAGVYPLSPTLDSVGPLTRSAADAALVYDAIQGPDPADRTTAGQSNETIADRVADGVAGMRLAIIENFFFDDVDPEVAGAVRAAAADALADQGAEVVSVEAPEVDEVLGSREAPHRAWTVAAEACVINRRFLATSLDELDPVVSSRMGRGFELGAVDFLQAFEDWDRLRRSFDDRTAGIDAFLVPSTPLAAKPVVEVDAHPDTYARFNAMYLRNTSIGNRFVWCGPSVPCGFTTDGMPIGLMIQGRSMAELTTLRVAHAYQRATDHHLRRPGRS